MLYEVLLKAAVKADFLLAGTTAVLDSGQGQGQQAKGEERKKQGVEAEGLPSFQANSRSAWEKSIFTSKFTYLPANHKTVGKVKIAKKRYTAILA